MKNNSRIKFNPITKEIEIEGNEEFVKTYFDKLQVMLSGPSPKTVPVKRVPKAVKAPRVKKAKAPKAVKPAIAK
ncbi:MAG: hypothetical protein MUP53_08315, partial [Bacteroidales bacterium]|nr:hypothetical protein [Bacteroidales bacterium]